MFEVCEALRGGCSRIIHRPGNAFGELPRMREESDTDAVTLPREFPVIGQCSAIPAAPEREAGNWVGQVGLVDPGPPGIARTLCPRWSGSSAMPRQR